MISSLYKFPESARVGKVVSKSKIYEHATLPSKIKELFVRQVEKIIWSYKLSPETLNLPEHGNIKEIQVFTVVLKTGTLAHEVLQTIDKAIPSPILYILNFDGKIRYIAAYKRPNEADKSKNVVSSYFETNWAPDNTNPVALPVVLDLLALYHTMLRGIIPLSVRQNETLDELVSRVEKLRIKEREAEKLEKRLNKEKQFNRKVEINAALRIMRKELEILSQ